MPDDPGRPGGTGAPPDTKGKGAGSFLSSKMMGLPTWAWIALAAAGGVVALVWIQNRRGSTPPTTDTSRVPDDQAVVSTEQYESLLALLRDIQGAPSTPTTPTTTPTTGTGGYNPPPLNPALKKGVGWDWVRKNDTLASIAARWPGATTATLKQLNTANALNRLTPGEAIRVRAAAGPGPT